MNAQFAPSWWHRRPGRLTKTLLAWAIANPLGWLGAAIVLGVGRVLFGSPDNGETLRAMLAFYVAIYGVWGSLFTYPFTLAIGVPVQALLQRRGTVSLVPTMFTALVIGYPVGVIVLVARNGGAPTLTEKVVAFVTNWDGAVLPLFLLIGSMLFWLIRRPDRDR